MSDTRQPNFDEVICPKCVHQFRAIPVNVQEELAALREQLAVSNTALGTHAAENVKLKWELAALRDELERER